MFQKRYNIVTYLGILALALFLVFAVGACGDLPPCSSNKLAVQALDNIGFGEACW